MRAKADQCCDYRHFNAITARWMDNDVYGHVNNVIYYSWFDTAVNQFLIANNVLDIEHSSVVGLVIETQCNYFAPVYENLYEGIRIRNELQALPSERGVQQTSPDYWQYQNTLHTGKPDAL